MSKVLKSIFDKTWKRVQNFDEIEPGDELCYCKFPRYRWMIVIEKSAAEGFVGIGYNLDIFGKVTRVAYKFKDHTYYKAIYKSGQIPLDDSVKEAKAREHEEEYSYLFNYARAFTRYCKTRRKGILDKLHIRLVGAHPQSDVEEQGDPQLLPTENDSLPQEETTQGAEGGNRNSLHSLSSEMAISEKQVGCTEDGRLTLEECVPFIEARIGDMICPDHVKTWLNNLTAEMFRNRFRKRRDRVVLAISGGSQSGKKYFSHLTAEILFQCDQTNYEKMEMLDVHDVIGSSIEETTKKCNDKLKSLENRTIYINQADSYLALEHTRHAMKTVLNYRASEGNHAPAMILACASSWRELRANHSFLQPHLTENHILEIGVYSVEMLAALFQTFAEKDDLRCASQTTWLANRIRECFRQEYLKEKSVGLSLCMYQNASNNSVHRAMGNLDLAENQREGAATFFDPNCLAELTERDIEEAIKQMK